MGTFQLKGLIHICIYIYIYIGASIRPRRGLFSLVGRAPAQQAGAVGLESHKGLHARQHQSKSRLQVLLKRPERTETRDMHASRKGGWRTTPRQRHVHLYLCGRVCLATSDGNRPRIRGAAWPRRSGGVRVSFPRWLLHFRAGIAAHMLSTKHLVLRRRNRTALDLDIWEGGRELDSVVELIRAIPPNRLLKCADRNQMLIVNCSCKPHGELHQTCRCNTEQHLAREPAIALT